MPRRFIRRENWEFGGKPDPTEGDAEKPQSRKRRLAVTLAFTTMFFAGASLAGFAGNQFRPDDAQQLAGDASLLTTTDGEATDTTAASTPDTDPADGASTDATTPAQASLPTDAATSSETPALDTSEPTHAPALPQASSAPPSQSSNKVATATRADTRGWTKANTRGWSKKQLRTLIVPKPKAAAPPEIEGPPSAATIWLNAQLPDPTPPALRLSPRFAKNLKAEAKGAGLDWATMLGILRARGATGHTPADRTTLRKLASRLASSGPAKGDWARIISYSGDTSFADRAAALARYDRGVGLKALVKGLEAGKKGIATRLLADPNVSIYEGGRNDIVKDKVDVRVLAVIAYLRESFGQVTVSSLISGHRLYARPGVISAHIPGHAVDISGLGDTAIQGHQEPGGLTERAVRDLLFLPAEVMPRQIISLLGLGGASFPLADHYNHIHIGF